MISPSGRKELSMASFAFTYLGAPEWVRPRRHWGLGPLREEVTTEETLFLPQDSTLGGTC